MIRKLLKPLVKKYIEKVDPSIQKEFIYYYRLVHHSWNYDDLYQKYSLKSNTPKNLFRRDRFYNLISSLNLIEDMSGKYVECGSWLGLSSALICSELKRRDPSFTGTQYLIVDSFEGLSKPDKEDGVSETLKGHLRGTLPQVQHTLSEFQDVTYVKGWLPEVLKTLPEAEYSFVHIDVDLVNPTVSAIEYFYPRLKKGGVLVCDDFACHVAWPNLKPAVMESIKKLGVEHWFESSTAQLIVLKK